MKIKVLKRTPNELKIKIEGETQTLCNVLQKALLEDDTIEIAGYDIEHPLVLNPVIYVRTKGQQEPEAALREAAKKIQSQNKEFRKSLKKALKEWERK